MGLADAIWSSLRGFSNNSVKNANTVYGEVDDQKILHVIADLGQGARFQIGQFDLKTPSGMITYSVGNKQVSIAKLVQG